MFDGFTSTTIDTGDAAIRVRHGGRGVPLLLLHGNPQTHVMWHLVAPRLAREFTVIAADLRGYGDSSRPPSTEDHAPYSKRTMANDMVAVMRRLGFDRFFVAGHDRGGAVRVPHGARSSGAGGQAGRARHHPDRGRVRLRANMARSGSATGTGSFWRSRSILPERLIGADPDYYFLRREAQRTIFTHGRPRARRISAASRNPEAIHAICEDYRAGATIDVALDEADRGTEAHHVSGARSMGTPRLSGGLV